MHTTPTVVEDATVLWGPGLDPVERTSLVLRDGRIAGRDEAAPTGTEVVSGEGLLLLPGFVDAHVHIGFAEPSEVLRRGVTTVRDLGWPEPAIFPLAHASRAPSFEGPLVLPVGPILTAPGGYPTRAAWAPAGTGREVAGPEDARAAVEDLAAAGAVAIKVALNPPVGPVLDHATLTGIVSAAHASGLIATAHVHGIEELHKLVGCGVDELAHMLLGDDELDDAVIRTMVDRGVTIVPTLSIRFGSDRALAISNLARFRAAGGNVVYGTDLGNEGPAPGIDRREVSAMAEAGFSALDIVRTATIGAARHLRLETKGVLDTGRDADVIAVPVDALERPELLCDVRMVWREGRRAL